MAESTRLLTGRVILHRGFESHHLHHFDGNIDNVGVVFNGLLPCTITYRIRSQLRQNVSVMVFNSMKTVEATTSMNLLKRGIRKTLLSLLVN